MPRREQHQLEGHRRGTWVWRFTLIAVAAVALFRIIAFGAAQLVGYFWVFALAVVIGFYVIGQVHHALHTRLCLSPA